MILLLPLFGSIFLFSIPTNEKDLLKKTTLNFSCLTFILSLFLWIFFDESRKIFQFVTKIFWINTLNLNIKLGIDGISLFFVLLTTLLIPLC
jgi:NADH-quinone oxidoreductase subunit M